jgi:hypothetical protein
MAIKLTPPKPTIASSATLSSKSGEWRLVTSRTPRGSGTRERGDGRKISQRCCPESSSPFVIEMKDKNGTMHLRRRNHVISFPPRLATSAGRNRSISWPNSSSRNSGLAEQDCSGQSSRRSLSLKPLQQVYIFNLSPGANIRLTTGEGLGYCPRRGKLKSLVHGRKQHDFADSYLHDQ